MSIEELLNNISKDMTVSRKDGFKAQQENALWGIVAGALLLAACGYWTVWSFLLCVKMNSWFLAALSGWHLKLAVDGLGTMFGAIAKYRRLEHSVIKDEVVGR